MKRPFHFSLQKLVHFLRFGGLGLLALHCPLNSWAQHWTNNRGGVPEWEVEEKFKTDVFTFVRIKYTSLGGRYYWGNRGGKWAIDYPDSDLNFSYRLQEMTSLKVNPNGKTLWLTDPELFHYPFIYLIEPGNLRFSADEVRALRKYLLGGGFMMVDDFWGESEWHNFHREIKRVFPEREPQELPLSHPIFNCVFPLDEKPQIPNVDLGMKSRYHGITWERWDAQEVHYKGIFDDQNRLMAVICHNTDLGDGWEWEGYNEYFFREFSEKKAYPLGINIVVYALTH
ncbi:MAG: hypothetical protein M2R45_04174 [Verrucomicrobia subdivision 3 bacterium]|nr:hypothetical protein [Limisphaerales bacterium]MCS1413021.1 hypothetical protein [Limisphaerales bacterium]